MSRILSVNGGGIRGIIPACALMALERQTGKLARESFDYVAGTSTGALIAAAVAIGIPATEMLSIYTDRTKEIFRPSGAIAQSKRFVVGFMYDPNNVVSVLRSVFGPAENWRMNDCPIRVMITATAMNGHNWYFVKDNPKNAKTTGAVSLIDAAVASACAPTYFDHWKMAIDGKDIRFFDGGAGGLANPSYQACVEAFEYDDLDPQGTRMVSLGTGFAPGDDTPPSGLLATIGWATSSLVDSSEDWVDGAVERQWPGITKRLNPQIATSIDEADLSAIPALLAVGKLQADALDWAAILGA